MDINEFGGGYSDNVKFVKDKTLRVLVPYAIVGLFLCLLQDRDISQMLNGISHLWFLMTIFECYVLGKLVDTVLKMQERKVQLVMGGLVLFIVLIPYRIPLMQFLCLSNIIKYFFSVHCKCQCTYIFFTFFSSKICNSTSKYRFFCY